LEVTVDIRELNARIAIRVPHAWILEAAAVPPLAHVLSVVPASLGMCGPVFAAIVAAIASANPAVNRIIGFRMLDSPVSGVHATPLLLTTGIAAGALPIAKARIRLELFAANEARKNNAIVHGGFSASASCRQASHG